MIQASTRGTTDAMTDAMTNAITRQVVEHELGRLDGLISLLKSCPDSPEMELVHEHVQSARTYLLGAMTMEYSLNLALALWAVEQMPRGEARSQMQDLLTELLEPHSSLRQ